MTTDQALLSVDRVEATYDHAIRALSGVSLTVRPGEIVALIGANGAGKTTTLKAVSGLLAAERGQMTAGHIAFAGEDIARVSPHELVSRGLVQVLEGRHCFRSLTVEENLITGALNRRTPARYVREQLEDVYQLFPRLKERRCSLAGLTSGGEQQMVAIGRALMAKPRLLVLDEPSMGLAPLIVEHIFKVLKDLNRRDGLSILVAEQNSTIALRYADRATVLENGRAVLDGDADELRRRDDVKAFYLGAGPTPSLALA